VLTASTINLNILTQFTNQTSTLSTILPTALPYLSISPIKGKNSAANQSSIETNSTNIIINDEIIIMAIIIDSRGAMNNITITVKVIPPDD
jgi:hypothetical protein